MNIKNPRAIREAAREALAVQTNPKKIPLVYAGLSAALSLTVTVICYVLSLKIDQMTGLANLGNRAIFSTVKSVLPFAQLVFLMVWEMGYHICTLRIHLRYLFKFYRKVILLNITYPVCRNYLFHNHSYCTDCSPSIYSPKIWKSFVRGNIASIACLYLL